MATYDVELVKVRRYTATMRVAGAKSEKHAQEIAYQRTQQGEILDWALDYDSEPGPLSAELVEDADPDDAPRDTYFEILSAIPDEEEE